ncbi:DUF2189 domain-containing protein [Brevundimonas sp.]|jgi:uncharacterized membrane protein|uniref:DUF2189 domain-containing protein n=1 Tax=Brevundimonas sp. TaxID=1871086 RepID=UPI002E10D31D|nr:DUF2189 domain-containing protein [Brevundimonas sp.]
MTVSLPSSARRAAPEVRRITDADLTWALSEGWRDFNAKRGDVVVVAFLYPLMALVAAAVTMNDRLVPLFFPLVAGLSIMGPAVAAGFYEIARRREEGLDSSWRHFLDPLGGRGRGPLVALTLMLLGVFVAWLAVAWAIYAVTLGQRAPTDLIDFARLTVTTPEGWAMIGLGNLAGLGFAALTLVLTVVSFPMTVDRPVTPDAAVGASLRAFGRNPGVLSRWGLRVALLLALGSLPLFLGLPVVLPVLGYATWHLYTRLVVR